jgi:2'-5' RNA ligase
MSRTRTFIAIDPGKDIRNRLVALQEQLAKTGTEVKWVERENLHVTLLFLGEVDERDLPAVCKAVTDVAQQTLTFPMSVERASCFGSPRRPRTLWAGVGEGTQAACTLHDALELPLLELGCYRREERQFTPHITLGRVKSNRPTDKLAAALAKNAGWQGGETLVREVLVMGSELTPEGPVYTVLSRGKLA